MVVGKKYIVARNASGRPTVQHTVVQGNRWRYTACGVDTAPWSVAFLEDRIKVIACRRPGCKETETS